MKRRKRMRGKRMRGTRMSRTRMMISHNLVFSLKYKVDFGGMVNKTVQGVAESQIPLKLLDIS